MSFIHVAVQPAYGKKQVAVTWNVPVNIAQGRVYVYRSTTGLPPWDLLNTEGVPAGEGYYVDNIAAFRSVKLNALHYRLALELGEDVYDSPIIGIYGHLNAEELKTIARIMGQELDDMRRGNGVNAFMYAPLTSGFPCPGYDSETSQYLGDLVGTPTGDCYGTPFIGGFSPPVSTMIKLLNNGQTVSTRSADGNLKTEEIPTPARMLAFPKPQPGYLVVLPATDDRYIIGDNIIRFNFKGIMPIGYEVNLQLLRRTDPRYRVPVPL